MVQSSTGGTRILLQPEATCKPLHPHQSGHLNFVNTQIKAKIEIVEADSFYSGSLLLLFKAFGRFCVNAEHRPMPNSNG
jgi:hypothetical protein